MTSAHQFVVAPQSHNSQDVAFSEVKYIVPLFYTNRKQLWENNLILNNKHGSVSPCIPTNCFYRLSQLPLQEYSAMNSHLPLPQGPENSCNFHSKFLVFANKSKSSTYFRKPIRAPTAPSKTKPCPTAVAFSPL